jgi:hypothetical protein
MNEQKKEDNAILHELKKISKILTLVNAAAIEKELSKIANTDARKKMWVLIDGQRMPKNIAKEVGVTQMAVSYFLNIASAADFIEYTQREPPHKILDYVPPSWIDLVLKEKGGVEQETSKKAEDTEDAKHKASEKGLAPQTMEADSTILSKQEEDGENEQGRE